MMFILSTLACGLNLLNTGTYQTFSFTALVLATEFPCVLNFPSFIDIILDKIKM